MLGHLIVDVFVLVFLLIGSERNKNGVVAAKRSSLVLQVFVQEFSPELAICFQLKFRGGLLGLLLLALSRLYLFLIDHFNISVSDVAIFISVHLD